MAWEIDGYPRFAGESDADYLSRMAEEQDDLAARWSSGGYSQAQEKVDGSWHYVGTKSWEVSKQRVRREAQEAANTKTYSNHDYTRFVYTLIERAAGARIINAFEEQGYMYIKLDQSINVGLIANIIERDTGLKVYEVPGDGSYVVLRNA